MIKTRTFEIAPAGEAPTNIAVHMCGTGPLALLIHGFPLDHRMWLDVMNGPLAARRTLCAIDLRGHGQSSGQPSSAEANEAFTMERLADDVAAVIKQLSSDPIDVCGLSMGGYVAFALHARQANLVRSLVLTNTRAAADTDAQRAGRDAGIEMATKKGSSAVADAMLPKLLGNSATAEHQSRIREMIEQVPVATIVADQRGLQQRPDRRPELPHFQTPTMVLVGDQDIITPQAEAEQMAAAIPAAQLSVITGTGHMSPLEDALQWSTAVANLWQ